MRGGKNVNSVLRLVMVATFAVLLIEVDKVFARKYTALQTFVI